MKVTISKKGIPRNWRDHTAGSQIIYEKDICIIAGSRLRMKLLVFKTAADLKRFWRNSMDGWLPRGTLGVVNGLAQEVITVTKGRPDRSRMECDPRYFCVMGLVAYDLCFEVIVHESVHAGFCYSKRVKKKNMWPGQDELPDEESVCYPAGRIARQVNIAMHNSGMYKMSKRIQQHD